MAKYEIVKATTSKLALVFIQDSSSTTGAGLAGLAWNSASISAFYYREGAGTGATAITLATMTIGTWASGGFVEVDASDMPGWYELGVPDAALATGANYVGIQLKGATNMAQSNMEIELTNFDQNEGVRGGLTALPNAAAEAAGGLYTRGTGAGQINQATNGQIDVDVAKISGDSDSANNLELMYDGTGYTDETAPASRQQVDNIGAATGAALSYEASADNTSGAIIDGVTIVGSITANLFSDTDIENGTRHQLTHSGNAFDFVYKLPIGGGRTAATVEWKGYLTSNNDSLSLQVYDHPGAGWDTIATITGSNGTANGTVIANLLSKHTGTGSELGNVYIRFVTSGQSSPVLNTDLLLVQAVNIGQSVGYANGSIWINTALSNTNTEPFVDGVADNPVSTIAAAKTLSTSVGIVDFHVFNGSSITFAETAANESYFGDNWTLALNGQTVTGAHIQGASVSGTQVGAAEFFDCEIGALTTIDASEFGFCTLTGTITLPAGDVYINNSHHGGAPVLDFGAAVGNTTVHMHKYAGGIELHNFGDTGTDVLHIDGQGKLTINANSSGGTINIRGNWQIVNNASGVTINYDDQSDGYANGQIWVDTVNGTAGTNVFINGTANLPVLTWADALTLSAAAGLTDFHIINGSTILLTGSVVNYSFFGDHWNLQLGGRDITGTHIEGATVTGIATATAKYEMFDCSLGAVTLDNDGHFQNCDLDATFTLGQAGTLTFHSCFTESTSAVSIDFGALGTSIVHLFEFHGEIDFTNMAANDLVHITGAGEITTTTCTAGTIDQNGFFEYTDAGGNVTKQQSDIKVAVDATLVDTGTTIPTTLGTPADTDLATDIAAIDTVVDAIPTTAMRGTDGANTTTPLTAVQVNAEVSDVMTVDTYAQPAQGAPPATATFEEMITYIYKSLRNANKQSATEFQLLNDDGVTVDHKATVSESGGVVTKGELATGP